jgi:hypothetical protein
VEYDTSGGSYRLWSRRPTRVTLPFDLHAESATLAVDGRGRMWIASAAFSDVNVRWSDAPYSTWSDTLHLAEGVSDDDICSLVPMPGKIGLLWSNQNTQRFGFKIHNDGADPRSWSADEAPASEQAQNRGKGFGDDHMNIKCASDGTLYCAVKTSYDIPGYPKLGLLVRRPAGGWSFYPVCSVEGTRPLAVLNESAGWLKVVYTTREEGGDIIYRETSLSNISFGPPRTLLSGRYLLSESTSTHQLNTGEVVILATNQSTTPKQAMGVLARDAVSGVPAIPNPTLSGRPEMTRPAPVPATFLVYPNPAGGTVTARFVLPGEERYSLVLYDLSGVRLREIKNGKAGAGAVTTVVFDASGLANGTYLLQLQTASACRTVQLVAGK